MSSKKKIILICAAAILVLAAIGVGIFFVLNSTKEYTVTFNTVGGTKIAQVKAKENEVVGLPEEPEKEGYNFLYYRNVLKRHERIDLLIKRGQWKKGDRGFGLPKTKPEE